VILDEPIDDKGRVLTSVSNFWFAKTKHIIDNKTIPLFKLTWKLKDQNWSPNSFLAYLFKGE